MPPPVLSNPITEGSLLSGLVGALVLLIAKGERASNEVASVRPRT